MLQLMQEEATEARISEMEPTNVEQQTASVAVTDAGTEAPSSSTVALSSSLSNDEIANGYRYHFNNSLPAVSHRCKNKKNAIAVIILNFFLVLSKLVYASDACFKLPIVVMKSVTRKLLLFFYFCSFIFPSKRLSESSFWMMLDGTKSKPVRHS